MYNAGRSEDILAYVPALQACAKGVFLTFGADPKSLGEGPSDQYVHINQKKLRDGRTVHIYLNRACPFRQGDFDEYLGQVESF